MDTIINGLLIQKAGSKAPQPGEERWFSWEQRQGKSGKPYIKIKNDSQEYGGKLCSIVDAEKTDFVDAHGNVSYNVGFTPAEPKDDDAIPMTHDAKGAALSGVDEAKRHLVQSANLYNLCADCVNTVIQPNIEGMSADLYQAAVGTLFIEASRNGLVSKMPTTKLK
jgi:hypothetical protein